MVDGSSSYGSWSYGSWGSWSDNGSDHIRYRDRWRTVTTPQSCSVCGHSGSSSTSTEYDSDGDLDRDPHSWSDYDNSYGSWSYDSWSSWSPSSPPGWNPSTHYIDESTTWTQTRTRSKSRTVDVRESCGTCGADRDASDYTDNGSDSDSQSATIYGTLSHGQSAVLISPDSASVTVGSNLSFTASGGSGTGAYTWGGSASGTGSSKSVTFNSTGSFSVTVYRAGDPTYSNSNTATAIVTVYSPTAPAITWAAPDAITYGTPLSATQLNAAAGVPGTFAYAPAIDSVLAAGSQTLSVTFSPTDTVNYTTASQSVTLAVAKAPLSISANDASKPEGEPNPVFAAAYAGFVNGDTAAVVSGLTLSTTATTSSPAGTYLIVPADASADNYAISFQSGTLTITGPPKTAPVITWVPPDPITYGTPLSATQLNATADVPGSFSYDPAAGTVPGAGPKTLTMTFTPTDAVNYSTASASVGLTVQRASLTVTANNATRMPGEPNPVFSAAYSGFVNGDTAAVVSGLTISTSATTSSPPGIYPITPANATTWNYSPSYIAGTLTISPNAQTVLLTCGSESVTAGNTVDVTTASGTGMIFTASGGMSGSYNWTIDGVVQSETGSTLTKSFTFSGTHIVSVRAAANSDYNASEVATFEIAVTGDAIWTVATGLFHAIALRSDGTVWTWGGNDSGQLGDGTISSRDAPMQVSGLAGVVAVAAGAEHSIAVKADGTIWTWGDNGHGQLGNGTTVDRTTPTELGGLNGGVAVAAGSTHTLILMGDGTVLACGANGDGQLGDGSTAMRTAPVQVANLASVTALAAGNYHSVAVTSSGQVWTWGRNELGALGDGTTVSRSEPVQVPSLIGVTSVSAGAAHTLALKNDGAIYACGCNTSGQLGDGTLAQRNTPVQVTTVTNVQVIAAGRFHSVAAKTDGSVWAWGKNNAAQLGDGTATDHPAPVEVIGLTDVVDLSASVDHTIAVKIDGTVFTWGGDGFGQPTLASRRLNQIALRLTPALGIDSDQDGMVDAREIQYFGNLIRNGAEDSDSDGLSDVQELFLNINPTASDTDGDSADDAADPFPKDPYNNEAPTINVLSGDNQTGQTGEFNGQPFDIVITKDPGSQLLTNLPVTFSVVSGGGLLATSNIGAPVLSDTLILHTDEAGTVKAYYKHPGTAGISSQVKVAAGPAHLFLTMLSSSAADADGNGLLDSWEIEHFGHTGVGRSLDPDLDGLTNLVEFTIHSDPVVPDTDGDGMNDGDEYDIGRDPLNPADRITALPADCDLVIRIASREYLGFSQTSWTLRPLPAP